MANRPARFTGPTRNVRPLLGFNDRVDFQEAFHWSRGAVRAFLEDVARDPQAYGASPDSVDIVRSATNRLLDHNFTQSGFRSVLHDLDDRGRPEKVTLTFKWLGMICQFHTPYDLLGYILSRIGRPPQGANAENYYFPLLVTYVRWCYQLIGAKGRVPNMTFIGYPAWSASQLRITTDDEYPEPSIGTTISADTDEQKTVIQRALWKWMREAAGVNTYGTTPDQSYRTQTEGPGSGKFGHCAETQALLVQLLRDPEQFLRARPGSNIQVNGFAISPHHVLKAREYHPDQLAGAVTPPCANCERVMIQFYHNPAAFSAEVLRLFRSNWGHKEWIAVNFPSIYRVMYERTPSPPSTDEELKQKYQQIGSPRPPKKRNPTGYPRPPGSGPSSGYSDNPPPPPGRSPYSSQYSMTAPGQPTYYSGSGGSDPSTQYQTRPQTSSQGYSDQNAFYPVDDGSSGYQSNPYSAPLFPRRTSPPRRGQSIESTTVHTGSGSGSSDATVTGNNYGRRPNQSMSMSGLLQQLPSVDTHTRVSQSLMSESPSAMVAPGNLLQPPSHDSFGRPRPPSPSSYGSQQYYPPSNPSSLPSRASQLDPRMYGGGRPPIEAPPSRYSPLPWEGSQRPSNPSSGRTRPSRTSRPSRNQYEYEEERRR